MCKLAQSIKFHMFATKTKIPKVRLLDIHAVDGIPFWTSMLLMGFGSGDDTEASQVSPSKVSQIGEAPATTSPKNAAPSQNVALSKKPASDSSVKGPHTCSYGINCLFPNLVPIDCQKCALQNKEVKVCIYHVYTVYMLYIF